MLDKRLISACESLISSKITGFEIMGGGSINHTGRIWSETGQYFLKYQSDPQVLPQFEAEAKGLELIARSQSIKAPKVLGMGQTTNHAFLLLEFLPTASPTRCFWETFGHSLANLHKQSHSSFGLDHHNFIGRLPQYNFPQKENWVDFFIENRMKPQIRMATDQKKLGAHDRQMFEHLHKLLPDIVPEEKPALIHGDLWNGNFLCLGEEQPALIDPAICYAHREMDLAMTYLFGGFSTLFYQAYQEAFPLEPGWEKRMDIYQLYFLLVHVNLFGGGYIGSVRQQLKASINFKS